MPLFQQSDIDLSTILATLKQWVEIETPSGEPARVNALVDRVEARAREAGLLTERLKGTDGRGDKLIVRSHGAEDPRERTLVLAHLDTVHPLGTLAGALPWRETDGRIYGPGVYDMKAGALMALEALALAVKRGSDMTPVTIVFVPDEEVGSVTSQDLIEREAGRARVALVVEPARDGGRVVVARKGVAMFDLRVEGKPSHAGSKPLEGRSAVREAARLILALEAMNDAERGVTVTVGTIRGGTARNVIPAECRMEVDVRVPDLATSEEVLGRIKGLRTSDPDVRLRIAGGLNRPPFAQSADSRAVFEHARALAADLGIALEGVMTGGGSDGNFTAALGVPTLDGLGADGSGAHTLDEHVFVDSIAPRTALLANLYATLHRLNLGR